MTMRFRRKGTRFQAHERRDGSLSLYRAEIDGNPSWYFLGIFTTKGAAIRAAEKNAAPKPYYNRGIEKRDLRSAIRAVTDANLPGE